MFRQRRRVGGGQTLMMPRYGRQRGPRQQAEGNMSASVEAIRLSGSSTGSSTRVGSRSTGAPRKREGEAVLPNDDQSPSVV